MITSKKRKMTIRHMAAILFLLSLTSIGTAASVVHVISSVAPEIVDPPSPFTNFQYDYPQLLTAKSFDNMTGLQSITVTPSTVDSEIRVWGNLILRNTTTKY